MIKAKDIPAEIHEKISEIFDGPPGIKLDLLGEAVKDSTGKTKSAIKNMGGAVSNLDKQVKKLQKLKEGDKELINTTNRLIAETEVLGKRQKKCEAQGSDSHMLSISLNEQIKKVSKAGKNLQNFSDNAGYRLSKAKDIQKFFEDNPCYIQDERYQERHQANTMEYFILIDNNVQPYSWSGSTSRVGVICIECFSVFYIKRDFFSSNKQIHLDSTTLVPLLYDLRDAFGEKSDSIAYRQQISKKLFEIIKVVSKRQDIEDRLQYFPTVNLCSGVKETENSSEHLCLKVDDTNRNSPILMKRKEFEKTHSELDLTSIFNWMKSKDYKKALEIRKNQIKAIDSESEQENEPRKKAETIVDEKYIGKLVKMLKKLPEGTTFKFKLAGNKEVTFSEKIEECSIDLGH